MLKTAQSGTHSATARNSAAFDVAGAKWKGKDTDGRAALELYLRRPVGLRSRRDVPVRPAVAAAADVDVRPNFRNRGEGRRIWQRRGASGADTQARPVVLPLPFQRRSGDAGVSRV